MLKDSNPLRTQTPHDDYLLLRDFLADGDPLTACCRRLGRSSGN